MFLLNVLLQRVAQKGTLSSTARLVQIANEFQKAYH
jgi:hypothetical protein